MGRKPAPKPDDPEQSKRFLNIAQEVGATDDKALECALKKVASISKQRPPSKE